MGIIDWDIIELSNNLRTRDKLNRMLAIDPDFTQKIIDARFTVNEKYADSDFVCSDDGSGPTSGVLGVINSLIENNKVYRICANYDDSSGKILRFSLLELKDGNFKVFER